VLGLNDFVSNVVDNPNFRHRYRIAISPDLVGQTASFGFRSNEKLFVLVSSPTGEVLFQATDTNCGSVDSYLINQGGVYTATITRGSLGGQGAFTLGLSIPPIPPIPFLCGSIPYDTLYSGYDYITKDTPFVAGGDSVILQEGVVLQMEISGIIRGDGTLKGSASTSNPIILKPVESVTNSLSKAKRPSQIPGNGEGTR